VPDWLLVGDADGSGGEPSLPHIMHAQATCKMRQPNVIYITIRPAHNYLGNPPIWGVLQGSDRAGESEWQVPHGRQRHGDAELRTADGIKVPVLPFELGFGR